MTTNTRVAELPELPEPDWKAKDGVSEGVYSAQQVRDFGMACYQAALARQEACKPAGAVERALSYLDQYLSGGPISAPDWAIQLASILTGGDGCGTPPSAPVGQEPVKWPNCCDRSVPQALRYLANHERPSGGESSFNSAHLFQLAGEIEYMASQTLYAAPPAAQAVDLEQFRAPIGLAREVMWIVKNRSGVAEYDRLLQIIDQQAGKGMERG